MNEIQELKDKFGLDVEEEKNKILEGYEAFREYQTLLIELATIVKKNNDQESKEEDDLLDKMDEVWERVPDSFRELFKEKVNPLK